MLTVGHKSYVMHHGLLTCILQQVQLEVVKAFHFHLVQKYSILKGQEFFVLPFMISFLFSNVSGSVELQSLIIAEEISWQTDESSTLC